LKLPASILLNSAVCYEYPEIIEKIKQRGDDVLGHGRTNAETLQGLWEDDERRHIKECVEVITKYIGVRPTGWMGAGAAETAVTPDLLKEEGFTYFLDWPVDDQPIWMKTRSGPILSVPYPMELNDAGTLGVRHHTGREFADMVVDQFEELLEASEEQPLVCPPASRFRWRRSSASSRSRPQQSSAARTARSLANSAGISTAKN
jgi:allantoinase